MSDERDEWEIRAPVVAAIAVHAASSTDGVARMEPGLRGLLAQLGRGARQQVSGLDAAPIGGVDAEVTGDSVRLRLELAVTAEARAADVAHAVQRRVAERVAADTGLTVREVAVSILDVEFGEDAQVRA